MTDSLTTETQPELYSEHQLIEMWNDQADQYNQWDHLSTSEQLDWAQHMAIARDRKEQIPTEEDVFRTYVDGKNSFVYDGPLDRGWGAREERAATIAGLRAVLACWGNAAPMPPTDRDVARLVEWMNKECEEQIKWNGNSIWLTLDQFLDIRDCLERMSNGPAKESTLCPACEGQPAPGNSPCAVCGAAPQPTFDGDVTDC